MDRRHGVAAFGLVMIALSPAVTAGQQLDPRGKSHLDWQLFKATSTREYLDVAERYAQAGYAGQAKAAVDGAAKAAKTSGDWDAVARAYQGLGYENSADMAHRKSLELQH
jgi:Tfp pilus assembly protein PilF